VESKNIRGAQRYTFIVDTELTDLRSGFKVKARTTNLSLFGCGIDSPEIFPRGTKVRIEISYAGHYMVADARVAYSRTNSGMGVMFIGVEPEDERTLDTWIVELRCSN
jgi:hypothetical protein